MEDVVSNAAEAQSLCGEDAELPAPRAVAKMVADMSVAAEQSAGAFLISAPLQENDTRVVSANISLDHGMLKVIGAATKSRKLTRTAFLAQAAR